MSEWVAIGGLAALVTLILGIWKALELIARLLRWLLRFQKGETEIPEERIKGALENTKNRLLSFAKKQEDSKQRKKKWRKRDS